MRRFSLVILLGALLLGFASCGFSYQEKDLTPYVTLNAPSLDTLEVTLDLSYQVTDEDVEDAIHDLLLEQKTAVNQGKEEQEKEIGDGDIAAIYYTLVAEDGTLWSDGFDVGGNAYPLEVGAGLFPLQEVEEALLGLLPKEHL